MSHKDVRDAQVAADTAAADDSELSRLVTDDPPALGDSALGHAVRRRLALGFSNQADDEPDPIAAHDSWI